MSQKIFELLREDNIIHANRTLAAAIGLNEAVIYGALLGKDYYYRSSERLDGEDMFYATASDLTQRTSLTRFQQDRAVTHLEKLGLISTKVKGVPAKRHFKINQDISVITSLLNSKTSFKETANPVLKKLENKFQEKPETNINNNNNIINKKNNNKNFNFNLKKSGENNYDYGNYGNGKDCFTGMADGKNQANKRRPSFPGVVKLGGQGCVSSQKLQQS